jgi:hypothetical protein
MANKQTSKPVATDASSVLRKPSEKPANKTDAGSALSQSGTSKVTSKPAASTASQQLRNPKTPQIDKEIAGSVLSQRPSKPKAK